MPGMYERKLDLIEDLSKLKSEQAGILSQFGVYKWILGIITPLIIALIGFGAFSFNDIVDKAVANRIQLLDRLSLAISQANNEQWEDALSNLNKLRKEIRDNPKQFDEDFRNLVFENTLWALQNTPLNFAGRWIGEKDWKNLQRDETFINFLNDIDASEFSIPLMNALCRFKFNPSKETLNYLKNVNNENLEYLGNYPLTGRHIERANILFTLVLVAIVENDFSSVTLQLRETAKLHPEEYRLSDWIPYKATYINSAEFEVWARADSIINGSNGGVLNLSTKLDKAYELALKDYQEPK